MLIEYPSTGEMRRRVSEAGKMTLSATDRNVDSSKDPFVSESSISTTYADPTATSTTSFVPQAVRTRAG